MADEAGRGLGGLAVKWLMRPEEAWERDCNCDCMMEFV